MCGRERPPHRARFLFKTWDQKFSSGMLHTFVSTHPFFKFSFAVTYLVLHQSCTGAYTEHARSSFVSPTLETTSPACPRLSTSGFSGRCPNSRSFDDFSERLQTILFTLRDLVLNAVYNATAGDGQSPGMRRLLAIPSRSVNTATDTVMKE